MSNIKVAFIPPRGMVSYVGRGDIIMCLAQLLGDVDDPGYASVVGRLSRNKFTLLDNGANEGKPLSNEALANASKLVRANEIVLPDVLGEADETYEASMDYLKHYRMAEQNYMGVVQGRDKEELYGLIDKYAKSDVSTLGIPRRLIDKQYKSIRLDLASWIDDMYPKRFKVHFLGASSSFLKEPYYAAKYELRVRSIDTSLPFNYGLAGVQLEDWKGTTERKVDRPFDYFTKWHEMTALTTVVHNMRVYKGWCSGEKTPSGRL